VRILFTFAGGNGHLQPLLPIARAAQAAGHTVAFAGQPAMSTMVEDAGHEFFSTGGDTFGARDRRPLLELDAEREQRDLREGFARRTAPERATRIKTVCAEWRPDILVNEEADFGGVVVAESLGLPHASVLVIAAGSLVRKETVADPLDDLRAEHGLEPDPELAMLSRFLVLSPFPPSFRDPDFPLPRPRTRFGRTSPLRRRTRSRRSGSRSCPTGRPSTSPSARCSTPSPATSSRESSMDFVNCR
jgi:hypothetical protein